MLIRKSDVKRDRELEKKRLRDIEKAASFQVCMETLICLVSILSVLMTRVSCAVNAVLRWD